MYPMSTMQHPVRAVRRTVLRRVTAYRRRGYRVVVEQGMETPLHWKVLPTVAAHDFGFGHRADARRRDRGGECVDTRRHRRRAAATALIFSS